MSDCGDYVAVLHRASILLQQRRPADAESALREALSRHPDAGLFYMLLGQCRVAQDDPAGALTLIERALAIEPDEPSYHTARGHVQTLLGRIAEAGQSFSEALRLDPSSADAWRGRARLALERTTWTEAETAARRALELESDDEVARSYLATALRMQGKQADSREELAGLLAENPESDIAHCNLGWALLHEGRRAEAEQHFLEALRLDPHYPDAKSGLLEAFKARSPLYRLLLRFNLLSARFGRQGQWWIAGAVLLLLFTRASWGRQFPLASALLYVGLMCYIVATNLTEALGHLIILFDRRARNALTPPEKLEAALLGTLGVLGLGTIILAYWLNLRTLLMGGWLLFGLTLPLAHVFTNESEAGRRLFLWLATGIVVGGLVVVYARWMPSQAFIRAGYMTWVGCLVASLILSDNPRWHR